MTDSDKIRSANPSPFASPSRRDWLASPSLESFQDQLLAIPLTSVVDSLTTDAFSSSRSLLASSKSKSAEASDLESSGSERDTDSYAPTSYPWSVPSTPNRQETVSRKTTKADNEKSTKSSASKRSDDSTELVDGRLVPTTPQATNSPQAGKSPQTTSTAEGITNGGNSDAKVKQNGHDRTGSEADPASRKLLYQTVNGTSSQSEPLPNSALTSGDESVESSAEMSSKHVSERAERLANNRGEKRRSRDTEFNSQSSAEATNTSPSNSNNPNLASGESVATVNADSVGADSSNGEGQLDLQGFETLDPQEAAAVDLSLIANLIPAHAEGTLGSSTLAPHDSATLATNAMQLASGVASNGVTTPKVSSTVATEAPTAPRGSLSRFQESKLVQRVVRGFEQMQEGGGQVRIRLHPPELGTLQLTLRIEAMNVSAKLEVENSSARDALVNNAVTLRERLQKLGMEVEQFDVEIRPELASGNGDFQNGFDRGDDRSRPGEMESQYAIQRANQTGTSVPNTATPRVGWIRNGNNLDLTV